MAWTTEQIKAIAAYAKRMNYRIQMASSVGVDPKARFIDADGHEKQIAISEVVKEYQTNKKDEQRERARLRREEENRKPWDQRYKQV